MTAHLPAAIEQYLIEAGFSSTEILVLKKLLEDDSLTLRELAGKTGKSTGVLDQSLKKLIGKRIARREMINDQPRYVIESLDAVSHWVKEDMELRKETLDRRHQNFEQFMQSLKKDKNRPDMQHFSGMEGIQQAYEHLLESGEELLTLTPVLYLAEEDPLREFRVSYFRKRQYRKIFQRVLTPDSPLARRFQSRDPFEYRRTVLMPADELPLTFEKTIVGDTVACINFKDQTACLLKYPALAEAERATFEFMWARGKKLECEVAPSESCGQSDSIPFSTRLLSSLREFILGKKGLAMLALFAVVSAGLTYGLYKSNRELNLRRLQDKVLSIASTGALQFDAKDIDAIWEPEDIHKPEYAKLVAALNLIRRSNTDIQYAYLMRKTDDPTKLSFVADADAVIPAAKKDFNGDGIINDADAISLPGDLYDDDELPLIRDSFERPLAGIGTDQWGTFISAQAPVRHKDGIAVAIVGIDMFVDKLDELSAQTFAPLYVFIGFIIAFLLVRFWAVNRSLMEECWQIMRRNIRRTLLWIVFMILLALAITLLLRQHQYNLFLENTGEKLQAIAVTAANDFDPADLDQLHWAKDMKTEAYQRVFSRLNEIRNNNPEIAYAYILRKADGQQMYQFIADADANYNLPEYSKNSIHDIDPMDESDESAPTGVYYYDYDSLMQYSLIKPNYGFTFDQWGALVSGLAPIFSKDGKAIAILGFDTEIPL